MRNPALDAWGDYDRDDPYPLFAQVQADGPVHEVTLADGHRAWLIIRHEEAKAALNHAGLSKDMHAALARDGTVVAEGLPGPAFARHMLSVDPPDHTRLRRLASAAFSRPRIAALRPRVQQIVGGLLDDLQARGDTVVDLVESAGEAMADRLLIHYRLAVAQRSTRWVCTQTSICKIIDGRLATIDLLCSGFREI